MTKVHEVYVCKLCGNIVEVLAAGDGDLVCCGQNMVLQNANTVDAAKEKHVPEVKIDGNKVHVQVGSVPHPMTEEHYIMWIEIHEGENVKRTWLKPGDKPETTFCFGGGKIKVYEYCNLHGLWMTEV